LRAAQRLFGAGARRSDLLAGLAGGGFEQLFHVQRYDFQILDQLLFGHCFQLVLRSEQNDEIRSAAEACGIAVRSRSGRG
jgi:hypothetical protein